MSSHALDVFTDDELIGLLGHDPELLAIADAIAETRPKVPRRRSRSRRLALVAATLGAVSLLAWLTPLGAAIRDGFGDFSAWLTGEPGTDATPAEQAAFDRANARSWHAFPKDVKLRRLAVYRGTDGQLVRLFGFRTGDRLCLRVAASGQARGWTMACSPLAELRHSEVPVKAELVDHGFGEGNDTAWYGIQKVTSPAIQVAAGIVADGIRSIVVTDTRGRHLVPVSGNAFLYVAPSPKAGQHVTQIAAVADDGTRRQIPFASALSGLYPGPAAKPVPGPTRIERNVTNGRIGWLERRESRGEPLSTLPASFRRPVERNAVFGRVITPDPTRPDQIALTYNTSRNGTKPTGYCQWQITGAGGGGGCGLADQLFHTSPISYGMSQQNGSSQFLTIAGLASDDATKLSLNLATGRKLPVPLKDNAFLVDARRSDLPGRLVAYDNNGRIIGISGTIQDINAPLFPVPARGRAILVKRLVLGFGQIDVLTGPSSSGGICVFDRHNYTYQGLHVVGSGTGCVDPTRAAPLAVAEWGNPAFAVTGSVDRSVSKLRLRYADGTVTAATPRHGIIATAIPPHHRVPEAALVAIEGLDSAGKVIASQAVGKPKLQ